MTQQRPDLLHVEPVNSVDAHPIIEDLKEGSFDLIATATSKKDFHETLSQNVLPEELQLLRIWRTGEFYTFNQVTGSLNRLQDGRRRTLKSFGYAVDKFKVLPGIQDWQYSVDETANYYKKYLIQDEIERQLARKHPPTQSLPEINRQERHLERRWSFTSDNDSFYRRVIAGQVPLKVCRFS